MRGYVAISSDGDVPDEVTTDRPFHDDDLVMVAGANWNVLHQLEDGTVLVENGAGKASFPREQVTLLCPWFVDIWDEAEQDGIKDVGTPEGQAWCLRRFGVGGTEWQAGGGGGGEG